MMDLEEILMLGRWGDYQDDEGTWRVGITNMPEIKAQIVKAIPKQIDKIILTYDMGGFRQEVPDNSGYQQGYNQAIDDIRKGLGVEDEQETV